jgi:hypothetical protein
LGSTDVIGAEELGVVVELEEDPVLDVEAVDRRVFTSVEEVRVVQAPGGLRAQVTPCVAGLFVMAEPDSFLFVAVIVDGRDGPVRVTVDPVTILCFVDPPCVDLYIGGSKCASRCPTNR